MNTTIIALSYEDKNELKQIFGNYKNLKLSDFDSIEELRKEKNELIKEYQTKYPELKENNFELSDLPKLIYSENQLQFIEDAEENSLEIDYTYSGRGMFGEVCPCVRCDSHNDLKTKANTKIDSMGLGIVIYAQY